MKPGIKLTGLRDVSDGPICGDCAGRLLTKQYPVAGYQCPMCRRIWRMSYEKEECLHCKMRYHKYHICLKLPRRREAVLASRNKP
jgi:hypothetical protein